MRSYKPLYFLSFFSLTLFLSLGEPGLRAQELEPDMMLEVPNRVEMGGVQLKLTDEVREKIGKYAARLMENNYYFRKKVERADAYFPIVERVLKEEGVPEDFKYLVLQESGLVSDVVSSSNAVGFWQFKKATGMEVGLTINKDMDERKNITASTRGAAQYLKGNQASLRNWVYSLLSYYAGLAGAKSVLGEEYIGARKMTLDKHTHWYIVKFLAHRLAFENSVNRHPDPPLVVMEYYEGAGKTLKEIAREENIDYDDIQDYNKWLETKRVPEGIEAPVLLPMKMGSYKGLIVDNADVEKSENIQPWEEKKGLLSIFTKEPEPVLSTKKPLFYEWNGIKAIQARKGDNIDKLAMQAGISKKRFMRYNDLRRFDWIVPGQVYYIKRKRRRAQVPFHVVKAGETLWEISQEYGIRMKHLLKKNRMEKIQKLQTGRVIWMRKTRPENHPIEYKEVKPEEDKFYKRQHLNTHEDSETDLLQANTNKQAQPSEADLSNEQRLQKKIKRMEAAVEKEKAPDYTIVTPGKGNTEAQQKESNLNTEKPQPEPEKEKPQPTPAVDNQEDQQQKEAAEGASKKTQCKPKKEQKEETTLPKTPNPEKQEQVVNDSKETKLQVVDKTPIEVEQRKVKTSKPQAEPKKTSQKPAREEKPKEPKKETGKAKPKQIEQKEQPADENSTKETKTTTLDNSKPKSKSNPPSKPKPVAVEKKSSQEPTQPRVHQVEEGETLFRISVRYGIPVDSLSHWNQLDNYQLSIGQDLHLRRPADLKPRKIPTQAKDDEETKEKRKKPAKTQPESSGQQRPHWQAQNQSTKLQQASSAYKYTVRKGDTLYSIARQNGVSVKELLEWNNKQNPQLALGEKLLIKL